MDTVERVRTGIEEVEGGWVPLTSAAKLAGISYRQADHWCAAGLVRFETRSRLDGSPKVAGPSGSGHRRWLDADAFRVLIRLAELVRAGLSHSVAADLANQGEGPYWLPGGLGYLTMRYTYPDDESGAASIDDTED